MCTEQFFRYQASNLCFCLFKTCWALLKTNGRQKEAWYTPPFGAEKWNFTNHSNKINLGVVKTLWILGTGHWKWGPCLHEMLKIEPTWWQIMIFSIFSHKVILNWIIQPRYDNYSSGPNLRNKYRSNGRVFTEFLSCRCLTYVFLMGTDFRNIRPIPKPFLHLKASSLFVSAEQKSYPQLWASQR